MISLGISPWITSSFSFCVIIVKNDKYIDTYSRDSDKDSRVVISAFTLAQLPAGR